MKYLKGMIVLLLCIGIAYASYPQIYVSKAYNFGNPGVDAFEITLDGSNILVIWREIEQELVYVASVDNFCELQER